MFTVDNDAICVCKGDEVVAKSRQSIRALLRKKSCPSFSSKISSMVGFSNRLIRQFTLGAAVATHGLLKIETHVVAPALYVYVGIARRISKLTR